jgi:hypothetical protein
MDENGLFVDENGNKNKNRKIPKIIFKNIWQVWIVFELTF